MTFYPSVRTIAKARSLKDLPSAIVGLARTLLQRTATNVETAAPQVEKALAWGKHQHERLSHHVPSTRQFEEWLKETATRLDWNEPPKSKSLEHLEDTLNSVVASIRQDSDRRTRIFVNSVISKTTGVAAVSGIATLISTFGVASTGAAIGSLSGAAATTAKLYWLGSVIGLGTTAGGAILAGTGLGLGVGGGILMMRWLFGKTRAEETLKDHEKAILVAAISLTRAIRQQIASGVPATPSEMRFIAEHALVPLANQINQYWSRDTLIEERITGCQPFSEKLAFLPRRKLNQSRIELGRIAISALAAPR